MACGIVCGVHVRIVTNQRWVSQRWNIAVRNHLRRLYNLRVLDLSVIEPSINSAPQPQLRICVEVESPIINPVRKSGRIPDAVRIEKGPAEVGLPEGFINVGVPGTFRQRGGTPEGLPIIA